MGMKLEPARNAFEKAILSSYRIYAPVRQDCVWSYDSIHEASFHPRVASKIVGLAFLSVIAAWEEFLEESFLRYVCGGASLSGYSPRLRVGPASSKNHALELLFGSSHRNETARIGRWNDYDWVIARAGIFFRKSEPFSKVPTLFRDRLKDVQVIRNRVAHSSAKSRLQFRNLSNRLVGAPVDSPMDRGFSPGRLLIYNRPDIAFTKEWVDSHDFHWPDLYECYSQMFLDIAEILTPQQ